MWAGAAVTPVSRGRRRGLQGPGESRERRQRETCGNGIPSPPALRPHPCPRSPPPCGCRGEGADRALRPLSSGFAMASQPQPLAPSLPCASPTGAGGAGLAASSPEKGTARPKPPVRPKPRVLPKPAVPAKPSLPQPPPGPRHPRPELPSAEKLNRLAGPQPYSAGGVGGPVRRPSFTIKSPETSNGKGLPSPPAAAAEDSGSIPGEEMPPALLTPPRKSPSPFKVTPVPVATKPERFPGTTVEEILAKMDSREGPGSPDRARLSPFCPDPSPRFGSKTFSAFRRRPSGAADGAPPAEPHQTPQPMAGELGKEHDRHRVAEMSGSPPASPSCAGDPHGCRRPPSPADLSSLQPSALGAPGSPRRPASPAPGAPFQPTQPPISAPGSPHAPAELPAPGSPTPAPSSPRSPAQPPAEVPATPSQAPGAPCSTAEPQPGASHSPGSPHTPGEGSPDTGSPPTTPELPPRVTCPPGSPESAAECWAPPSPVPEPPVKVSCPPGSPEGPDDSSASPQSPKGPDSSRPPASRDSGLRRCSEGLLQPLPVGQGLGELGGSLSTLHHPGDPPPELSLGGWSLSQSFEWTFPGQGAQRLVSPPCSPIRETPDLGLCIEGELDGGDPAPRPSCSRGNSGSEGPGRAMASSRAAEGAPCPGGPVAQREAEGSAEEEEGEAEQDATVPCSPVCVTEPGRDPAEPETSAQPGCPIMAAPVDPALTDPAPTDPPTTAELAWAPVGDRPGSLHGPGGPGRAEEPSKGADPHADPGWLTELLASPRAHRTGLGSPDAEGLEDQLSWSPKDLCSDFGAGSPHHGTFDWSCEAVARERDWPRETERDQDPETKPDWDSAHSAGDRDRQDRPFGSTSRDWGSAYQGTELTGETSLGCSDWPESRGTEESCRQDQDFGAGKPQWGSGEESSPGRADWSSGCSLGHGQQRDREPGSRQHSWAGVYGSGDPERRDGDITSAWAGEYGTGDVEMKDRDLTLGWTRKYSSRGPETKDEDLTLGWAGRSSTGDTGTPEKEFSPSRVAWDSEYSAQDMESQDREFSPSRPAWTGDTSTKDMESQDREFSPSRPAWTGDTSTRDMESQDREFSPSRPAWTGDTSTRDMESQDREFSPSRPAWTGDTSTRDMESQDREFSPSRPAWNDEYRTRDVEMQDEEFSSSRAAWASEGGSREVESRDSGCRPAWDGGYSTGDVGSQDREFSPSQAAWVSERGSANTAKEGEFSHERLSWAGERSLGQTELVNAFGVGKDDATGCRGPEAPEPGWGCTGRQECGVTGSRDWAGELGGAERHNQFGVIGTERVPEPCSAGAPSDGSVSWAGGLGEPLGAWHRALDFGSSSSGGAGAVGLGQPAWGTGLDSLAVPNTSPAPNALPAPSALPTPGGTRLEDPGWSGGRDTEATHQEWASAFGARCAARSRDFSAGEQSLAGDTSSVDGTLHLSAPSPLVGDTLAVPCIEECPRSEPPSPTREKQDIPTPADPLHSPSASLGAGGGSLPDSESEGSPAEHPDGGSPPSGQEEQPCPAGPPDCAGQDFSFLEDTAVLDSSVYRSKASLGRKRPHRAPALRPAAAAEGDSWIFRDSTEPRPARPDASSDEEAVEEPRSRRVRASPLGRGVKVPLFPSLSASALKAKLRGRNRSAEEGAVPGDGKATPPRDPHVQRSKSCKIPGLSGKPLALPPKPDKSSGSDASPPHWLQALKLKKKKP
ncbi:182 kDa tankyrase-1-binding protein isoform X2 [Columba livia]|uniref:182 kDa tankyrase-1-binding protein isoform X2 n=1 Tax=Columba livia TaxID=8932 RepID=UPI0031BB119F